MEIPVVLARNVTQIWGEAGRAWLAGLPGLLADVVEGWGLQPDGPPFPLSIHWVVPVAGPDGAPAVLKVGLPGDGHLAAEAAALRAYGGRGAVRLLAYDHDRGALLLERAEPGTPARELVPREDGAALAALLSVRRDLHAAAVPADLPALDRLQRSFDQYQDTFPDGGPLPHRLVTTAARLFDELCSSTARRVVLHGDLHFENVLRSGRRPWLAIDPHGWVGDPGYDLGAILYNPDPHLPHPGRLELVPGRLEQLVEAAEDVPRERAIAWCFVKAVLSDVWNTSGVEPAANPATRAIEVAALLEPLL